MPTTVISGFTQNFLGKAPVWYKQVILLFLIINPIVLYLLGPGVAGWLLIAEFIFTLAMALKCYPLLPGGLLAVEALLIGLTTPEAVYSEVLTNFPVILLLMFMVAGIYFMKELLLVTFTQILVGVRSKSALSLLFCIAAALLSAFLDALTVTAVIISVAVGFYSVYHKVASGKGYQHKDHNANSDDNVIELHREDLENFRAFLRSLLMHGAIGTALGGVATMVGEPQNLLIAKMVGWDFASFFMHMAPVSLPVLAAGILVRRTLAQPKVRLNWDEHLLRWPVIGKSIRGYNTERFASTLSILVGGGVPILPALQGAADALANTALRRDVADAITRVREGASLARALGVHRRFPPILLQLIHSGESTGRLPEMLDRAARGEASALERRILLLTTLLEPALILVMGLIVALIVVAVLLPIIEINQMVR
ncbi:MAG: hypothetical protein B7X58_04755 [Marinobacter sp. 34-60-7]|nr:MAG: hypothetical protein B7X58_04755 [Marinobacter sp. 34-60-7]